MPFPINPPAMPYVTRFFLESKPSAFEVHYHGNGLVLVISVGESVHPPRSKSWFWEPPQRKGRKHDDWLAGPYSTRNSALAAIERYRKLQDGPALRTWAV